jgi:undecaprenyl-diphosphatase
MFGLWFSGKNPAERVRYQLAMLTGISALSLANVVVWLFNITWERPRPFVEHGDELNLLFYSPTDPSFPANPVAVGFAAAMAAWSVNRKFGWWMFAVATVYGFSRLYAGVFYPTDIIGGAIVGIAVFWFTNYLRRFLQPFVTSFIALVRGLSAA